MTHQEQLKLERRAIRGVKHGVATKWHSKLARKAQNSTPTKARKWQ